MVHESGQFDPAAHASVINPSGVITRLTSASHSVCNPRNVVYQQATWKKWNQNVFCEEFFFFKIFHKSDEP